MLAIGGAWSLLAAFDLWLLLIHPDASWPDRISFALGLVGVYTFAFGILSASGVLKWMPDLGRELTSPNPTVMIAGIFTATALLPLGFSVALGSGRTRESLDRRGGVVLYLLQTPVLLLGLLVGLAFLVVYLVLVAPLAWIAYVVASAPLDGILTSAHDSEIAWTDRDSGGETTLSIKQLVEENLVALRNGLVAVPALVSSLILRASGLF
jgi:hypothetical protein